jgi:LytR cell envelope-related transcriptional attenuator
MPAHDRGCAVTDLPEGSAQGERGPERRPTRTGDSSSPVGSTLSIILAVIAVVVGFLILRAVFDDDDGSAGVISPGTTTEGSPDTTAAGGDATTPTSAATPTTVGRVTSGTIIVANASGVGGSAGQMTTALEAVGYTLGEATDSSEGQMDRSLVYFVRGDADARATAESVARDMGNIRVQRLPANPPVAGGDIGDATVLVMLGTDAAGKTLAELNPTQVTAPSVAGTTTTTTG